jgi:hypothetical protein
MDAGLEVDGIRDGLEQFKIDMQHKEALKRAQSDQLDIERRAARLKRQQESQL